MSAATATAPAARARPHGLRAAARAPAPARRRPQACGRPVTALLAAEREVIAVDLPGFGGSPPLAGPGEPTPARARRGRRRRAGRARDRGLRRRGQLARRLGRARARARGPGAQRRGDRPGRPVAGAAAAAARARRAPPRGWRCRSPGALTRVPALRRAAMAMFVAHPERMPARAARDLIRAYALAPGFPEVNAAMRANTFSGLGRIRVPVTLAWPEHDRVVGAAAPPAAERAHGDPARHGPPADVGRPAAGRRAAAQPSTEQLAQRASRSVARPCGRISPGSGSARGRTAPGSAARRPPARRRRALGFHAVTTQAILCPSTRRVASCAWTHSG